jgi:hypothetical protein
MACPTRFRDNDNQHNEHGMDSGMKKAALIGIMSILISACASVMVQQSANNSCASQGKKAFLFDAKQNGIPLLIESASVMVLCVGPDDVVHLSEAFGADAVSSSSFHGAGITSVTSGSTAEKAGLKSNDIVYEFAERSISQATDLRLAVDSMSTGDQAVIKIRRNGGKDTTLTAHF